MDQILEQLRAAGAQARVERDRRDRNDPAGRYLSVAITEMESAENWLVRARHVDHETDAIGTPEAPELT